LLAISGTYVIDESQTSLSLSLHSLYKIGNISYEKISLLIFGNIFDKFEARLFLTELDSSIESDFTSGTMNTSTI